jgi:hypothetical protein
MPTDPVRLATEVITDFVSGDTGDDPVSVLEARIEEEGLSQALPQAGEARKQALLELLGVGAKLHEERVTRTAALMVDGLSSEKMRQALHAILNGTTPVAAIFAAAG